MDADMVDHTYLFAATINASFIEGFNDHMHESLLTEALFSCFEIDYSDALRNGRRYPAINYDKLVSLAENSEFGEELLERFVDNGIHTTHYYILNDNDSILYCEPEYC